VLKQQGPPLTIVTLVNGRGRYPGGPSVPLSVINVQQGRRYRFRLIAMSCVTDFTFSIDNHWMTVIEADGEYTLPHSVDSLRIFAGQRYSVIVNANQRVNSYWIRAKPNQGNTNFTGGSNLAIFRYAGAPQTDPSTDPTSAPASLLPLKESNLHALYSPLPPGKPFAGGADVVLNIATGFDFSSIEYTMNGVSYIPPTVPVLLQILSGARTAQDLLPKGSVLSLPPNKVIEISIPGTGLAIGGPVSTGTSISFRTNC
jgi:iron transport multicopper oxidase